MVQESQLREDAEDQYSVEIIISLAQFRRPQQPSPAPQSQKCRRSHQLTQVDLVSSLKQTLKGLAPLYEGPRKDQHIRHPLMHKNRNVYTLKSLNKLSCFSDLTHVTSHGNGYCHICLCL